MNGISDTIHHSVEQAKAELRNRVVGPLVSGAVIWGLVAVFGIIALIFLYVVLDIYLANRLDDPIGAAAIVAGGNLVLVLILIVARRATSRRR
jgi:preprotein translocase subunit SecF